MRIQKGFYCMRYKNGWMESHLNLFDDLNQKGSGSNGSKASWKDNLEGCIRNILNMSSKTLTKRVGSWRAYVLTAVTVLRAQGRLCLGHSNDCRERAARTLGLVSFPSGRRGELAWASRKSPHQGSWDPEPLERGRGGANPGGAGRVSAPLGGRGGLPSCALGDGHCGWKRAGSAPGAG